MDETSSQQSCVRGHVWPVVLGVLDCRHDVTGFDTEADRELAEYLHARRSLSFTELLREYWERSGLPWNLTERYVRGDVIGEDRSAEVVAQIEAVTGMELAEDTIGLEVGCGTAALGTALSSRMGWVVLSDISLAWLVLAKKRLDSLNRDNVTLIAAAAERVPYPTGTFSLVTAADVIEHVPDFEAVVAECLRVTDEDGYVWMSTPNRFSLTPEPHVRVWGVGILPRRLAASYVSFCRGIAYDGIRTLSLFDLRRLSRYLHRQVDVRLPNIPTAVISTYSWPGRVMMRCFNLLRRIPLVNGLLLLVSPYFHIVIPKRDALESFRQSLLRSGRRLITNVRSSS